MNYEKLAAADPKLSRGRVWCVVCGRTGLVDTARSLALGWPKCCKATMTIDSPADRVVMERAGRQERST